MISSLLYSVCFEQRGVQKSHRPDKVPSTNKRLKRAICILAFRLFLAPILQLTHHIYLLTAAASLAIFAAGLLVAVGYQSAAAPLFSTSAIGTTDFLHEPVGLPVLGRSNAFGFLLFNPCS